MSGGPKTATAIYRVFADLSVTLTDSQDPVTLGNQVIYTATLRNQGPSPATGVTLTITLPADVTVTYQGDCTGTTTLTCTLPSVLGSGFTAGYFVYVLPSRTGALVATAQVSATSTDLNLQDNLATQSTTVDAAPTPTSTPTPRPTATATPTAGPIGPTALVASPDQVLVGGTTTVTWTGIAVPTIYDWIALYRVGDADGFYLDYRYVDFSCAGSSASYPWTAGTCAFAMPTTPGTYEFRLYTNATYGRLATSNPVTVVTTLSTPHGNAHAHARRPPHR